MKISSIRGLTSYLTNNSSFSNKTIHAVIVALGYRLSHSTKKDFRELSQELKEISENGASCGWSGFTYYSDTIAFFKKHRSDIAQQMEQTAAEMGIDLIAMVQSFGVYRNNDKPTPSEVGKALWNNRIEENLSDLYDNFSKYVLEEVANTWYRYLEDNPSYRVALSV
jgi:hypothetical protein